MKVGLLIAYVWVIGNFKRKQGKSFEESFSDKKLATPPLWFRILTLVYNIISYLLEMSSHPLPEDVVVHLVDYIISYPTIKSIPLASKIDLHVAF